MKKLSALLIPMTTAVAIFGSGVANAQGGEPCDGLDIDFSWGCEDDAGWASVGEITGAVNPTTILWSSGASVQYVNDLPAGSHWVMVTDAEGCSVQHEFEIYCELDPDCMLDADVEWGCLGATSGWASVENITGATEATSILWSTGQTTQYVTDLPDGDHWVMVTSGEACWVKEFFSVNCYVSPDCELTATVDWGCFDTTSAWGSVNIGGATAPTSILWSTGEETQYITGLTNGDHWVMVTEAEDCWVKVPFTVACEMDPDCPLDAEITYGCAEEGEGWATVEDIIGANENTEVHWSNGDTTMSTYGLSSGWHYVVIMNSETCWMKHHFELECGMDPECELDATVDWGCNSATSGWASVGNITGATGSTSILWSNGETDQFVADLGMGDHWVMVTDSEGCWVKQEFTVDCYVSPDCMLGAVIDWGCFDTTSAWASVGITGATAPTSIVWSTGETEQYITGLTNGDHWVMVMEAEDCWVKIPFNVSCEMDPDCMLDLVIDHGCEEEGAGWATVEDIIGGNEFTEVHWSNGDTTMSTTGLSSGSHFVVIMNSETCWLKHHFELECGEGMNVQTFPMPANNVLNVEIETPQAGVISLVVTDAVGRIMMTHGNESFQAGEKRNIALGVNGFDNGSYMLSILRDGSIVRTERVIISR